MPRLLFVLSVLLAGCDPGLSPTTPRTPGGGWTASADSVGYSMCLETFAGDLHGRTVIDSGHVRVALGVTGDYADERFWVLAHDGTFEVWTWHGIFLTEDTATGVMSIAGTPMRPLQWTRDARACDA